MKSIKLIASLLIAGSFPFLFTSCSNGNSSKAKTEKDSTAKSDTLVVKPKPKAKTYYEVPAPNSMFAFIKQNGVTYNKDLPNSVKNLSNYNVPLQQQLNFGIYAADMAYTAAFEQYQTTLQYFGSISKLSDKIGISDAFSKPMINRIKNNLTNADSLVKITNDTYYNVIDYLQASNRGAQIAVMAAGGWLESIFIATQSIKQFKGNSPEANRLAAQKLVLENLFENFNKYKSNQVVQKTKNLFVPIKNAFDQLGETTTKITSNEKKGKLVFGGGTTLTMNKKQFESIKNIIQKTRMGIVKQY